MNTVEINSLKKYSEFTTTFRIPFKKANDVEAKCYTPMDVIDAWKEVCIQALEMRMEACLSMLLKNRDRVIESDEECVVFQKAQRTSSFLQPLQLSGYGSSSRSS